jgi:hypothetical protein
MQIKENSKNYYLYKIKNGFANTKPESSVKAILKHPENKK